MTIDSCLELADILQSLDACGDEIERIEAAADLESALADTPFASLDWLARKIQFPPREEYRQICSYGRFLLLKSFISDAEFYRIEDRAREVYERTLRQVPLQFWLVHLDYLAYH